MTQTPHTLTRTELADYVWANRDAVFGAISELPPETRAKVFAGVAQRLAERIEKMPSGPERASTLEACSTFSELSMSAADEASRAS